MSMPPAHLADGPRPERVQAFFLCACGSLEIMAGGMDLGASRASITTHNISADIVQTAARVLRGAGLQIRVPKSKIEFQCELHNAWVAHAQNLAEQSRPEVWVG
jgi:hypothetical protein